MLPEVGLLEVMQQRVGAQALEIPIAELVGPHPGHEVAEILDELAVLAGLDPAGPQGFAGDDRRRPSGLERLETQAVKPGGAATLAETNQERRDPHAAVGGCLEG